MTGFKRNPCHLCVVWSKARAREGCQAHHCKAYKALCLLRHAARRCLEFRRNLRCECTLNVIPSLGGRVLMPLTDGGMQYLIGGPNRT